MASTTMTFYLSQTLNHGKFDPVHVANSTLAVRQTFVPMGNHDKRENNLLTQIGIMLALSFRVE
jgi:hypothetical protein